MSSPITGVLGRDEQTETKPGIKTTEFWVTAILLLLNNLETLPIPDRYSGWMNVLIPVAYLLSRGLAKQGQPNLADDIVVEPESSAGAVDADESVAPPDLAPGTTLRGTDRT